MADDQQLEYDEEPSAEQPAQQRAPAQDTGSDLPVKQGAVFGAIAVIATYLTHLLLTAISTAGASPATGTQGVGEDASFVAADMVASWEAAGWSYLGVFGTGFEAEGQSAGLGDAPNHAAAFVSSPFALSSTFLFLVTIGGIVAAGYAVARYTGADDAVEATKAGVTVAVPYLVFAALVAIVMTHSYSTVPSIEALVGTSEGAGVVGLEQSQFIGDENTVTSSVEFGPSTTDAILYAGLVVPAVLGALGGLLTQRRDAIDTLMAKIDQQ